MDLYAPAEHKNPLHRAPLHRRNQSCGWSTKNTMQVATEAHPERECGDVVAGKLE